MIDIISNVLLYILKKMPVTSCAPVEYPLQLMRQGGEFVSQWRASWIGKMRTGRRNKISLAENTDGLRRAYCVCNHLYHDPSGNDDKKSAVKKYCLHRKKTIFSCDRQDCHMKNKILSLCRGGGQNGKTEETN